MMASDYFDLWKDGNWFDATFAPYFDVVGESGAILLLGVPFTMALWIQTGRIEVPSIILVLFVGLILGGAPPAAAMVGYLMVVVGTILAYRSIYDGRGAV